MGEFNSPLSSSEFESPEIQEARAWIEKQLTSKGLTTDVDLPSPDEMAVKFFRYSPEDETVGSLITTATVKFLFTENALTIKSKIAMEDLEGLRLDQQAALLGYIGTVGELVARAACQGGSIKDFDFRAAFVENMGKALGSLSEAELKKKRRDKEVEIGLEKNPFYKQWLKWIQDKMQPWGLQVRISVDPVNRIIISRVVDPKKYDSQRSFLSEYGVLLIARTPKDLGQGDRPADNVVTKDFSEANVMQQALCTVFMMTNPVAIVQAQLKPESSLKDLQDEFDRLYTSLIFKDPKDQS